MTHCHSGSPRRAEGRHSSGILDDDPVNLHLFFCFIEQLLSRTTDLSLFTMPAGQLSSHKSITEETQEKEGNDENEDNPRELLYQEHYACENGDNKH